MHTFRLRRCSALLTLFASIGLAQTSRLHDVRVTILSTMLADRRGVGEWGFAALVEADGRRVLFDTGALPDTVLNNAKALQVDISQIPDVILSHNHGDHTGGLLTLRREYSKSNPAALSRAHVGKGIFLDRVGGSNPMRANRAAFEAGGGAFIEYDSPKQIFPGAWLTGPVPRKYPERNFTMGGKTGQLRTAEGKAAEDNVPEDQSLVLDTDRGLVVISGCGHAGVVNTLEYARTVVRAAPVYAAIGGFHLFESSDETLAWTAKMLRSLEVGNFIGAHCTGIEAVYRIRSLTGLDRKTAMVGAVGATFSLKDGIDAGFVAR